MINMLDKYVEFVYLCWISVMHLSMVITLREDSIIFVAVKFNLQSRFRR